MKKIGGLLTPRKKKKKKNKDSSSSTASHDRRDSIASVASSTTSTLSEESISTAPDPAQISALEQEAKYLDKYFGVADDNCAAYYCLTLQADNEKRMLGYIQPELNRKEQDDFQDKTEKLLEKIGRLTGKLINDDLFPKLRIQFKQAKSLLSQFVKFLRFFFTGKWHAHKQARKLKHHLKDEVIETTTALKGHLEMLTIGIQGLKDEAKIIATDFDNLQETVKLTETGINQLSKTYNDTRKKLRGQFKAGFFHKRFPGIDQGESATQRDKQKLTSDKITAAIDAIKQTTVIQHN